MIQLSIVPRRMAGLRRLYARGVSTVEYAILAAGIALVVSAAASSGNFSFETVFQQMNNAIQGINLTGDAGSGGAGSGSSAGAGTNTTTAGAGSGADSGGTGGTAGGGDSGDNGKAKGKDAKDEKGKGK